MAYQLHPLAARYPRMTGKDFDLLVADIRKHGVRDPLVLLDGKLLDGRFTGASRGLVTGTRLSRLPASSSR